MKLRDAIRKRLSEATPGPWRHVCSPDGTTVATPQSTLVHYGGGYYSKSMRDRLEADHAFVAHARADIDTLVQRCRELTAALEFYACENNYHGESCGEFDCVVEDKGSRARAVLAAEPPKEGA
jgi:hypothetical protein